MSATGEAAGPAGEAPQGRRIGKRSGPPSERLSPPPTTSGLALPRVPAPGAPPPTASGLALPRVPAPGAPPSGRLPRVPPPGAPSAPPSGRLPRVPPPGAPSSTPSGRLPRVPPAAPATPGVDIAWPVIAPVAAPVVSAPVVAAPSPSARGQAEGDGDGDETAALVILGGADALTAPQVEAVGAVVKLTPYEVKLRFKGPVPRWGPVGPASQILPLADALRTAGVDAEAIAADLVLAPLDPVRVKSVRFEGEKVVLGGPRGEARIDLARPTLLVVGKVDLRASGDGVSAVGEARASVLFGHLYAGGRSEPFELLERDISDWSFLGDARTPVRRTNFEALLSRLATGPGVTRDDQLSVHHAKLKESALQGELLVGGGMAGVHERSTCAAADTSSRILYQLWATRQGHDDATLASNLEVLSEKAAPEEAVAAAFGGGPTNTISSGGASLSRPPSGRLPAPGSAEDDARFAPPAGFMDARPFPRSDYCASCKQNTTHVRTGCTRCMGRGDNRKQGVIFAGIGGAIMAIGIVVLIAMKSAGADELGSRRVGRRRFNAYLLPVVILCAGGGLLAKGLQAMLSGDDPEAM